MRSSIILLFLLAVLSHTYGKRPRDPLTAFYVEATVGQPWPKPQSMQVIP